MATGLTVDERVMLARSVARLLSKRARLDDDALDLLLTASGVDADDAHAEISMIATLLQRAVGASSDMCEVVVEGLALRGVPADQASEAVQLASGAQTAAQLDAAIPSAAPSAPPSQSHQLEPPIRLAMKQQQPASSVIPPPMPVAASIADVATINVDPEGHGAYTSLSDALEAAPVGAMVILSRGTHMLETYNHPLSSSVQIAGASMDDTEIVITNGALVYEGQGLFALRDLTIRWKGETDGGPLVGVEADEVKVERCHFSATGKGQGLLAIGHTTGLISECLVEGADIGFAVAAQASLTIEANTCRNMALAGIAYSDAAAGSARRNSCSNCGGHGIAVMGQATPALLENTCTSNQVAGIAAQDSSSPTLIGNTCDDNGDVGVSLTDEAAGSVRGCTASRNGRYGIWVRGTGRVKLEINTCVENRESGIALSDQVTGGLWHNTCRDNVLAGIVALEGACPDMKENTCQGGTAGIALMGSGRITVEGNTCTDTEKAGIQVGYEAAM